MPNSDKPKKPESDSESENAPSGDSTPTEYDPTGSRTDDSPTVSLPPGNSAGADSEVSGEQTTLPVTDLPIDDRTIDDQTGAAQTAENQVVEDLTIEDHEVDDQTVDHRTVENPTIDSQEGPTEVISDESATVITPADEPDAVRKQGLSSETDQTIVESEYHQASSEIEPPHAPTRNNAHETVSRWETEQKYQLGSNFARGGLGQIWMANDIRLRREVAYKELLPAALKTPNAVERFLEEAQITGQLEHPSIVPVYDIGYQHNGTPYYSMKLVRGETMEKHIEHLHQLPKHSTEFTLARRKLLGNFIDICNAIAFAHDRGVLHRDLKPLNVMLGSFGETLVLDWGLAKVLDHSSAESVRSGALPVSQNDLSQIRNETIIENAPVSDTEAASLTGAATVLTGAPTTSAGGTETGDAAQHDTSDSATRFSGMGHSQVSLGDTKRLVTTDVRTAGTETMMGSVMGTPAYMPPEQAEGKVDKLDARTDIYALGGILYKLLTNQPPIQKTQKIKDLLNRIIAGEIIPPRQHDPQIEKPLEAVCLKALSRKRKDRYECALALAADVEAFLADEPVSCFIDSPLVRARRWMKQNPRTVVGAGTTIAAALLVWIGSSAVHAITLADIRNFSQTRIREAQTLAQKHQFEKATAAISEAIGRTGSEPDLNDLTQFLQNRKENIEADQIRQIRTTAETLLETAARSLSEGRLEEAQSDLARVQDQTGNRKSLTDILQTAKTMMAEAENQIHQKADIRRAGEQFQQFRKLADKTRARSSLPGGANPREDAQQALSTCQEALNIFSLVRDQPLREPPRWFDDHLQWVREFREAHGKSPLEVLHDEAFELMILQADLELTLASNQTDQAKIKAARRALTCIARAESVPNHSQTQIALVWKAVCLRSLGMDDQATTALAAARELRPQGVLDFFLLGEKARKDSQYDKALRHYLNAIREDPGHFWTRYYMGLCYVQLGYPHAAVSAFSNAITLEEGNVWPVMMRAVAYAQLQMFEESLTDYEQAITLDSELFNIYVNRGFVYLNMDRHDEALQDYRMAAQLAPNSSIPHINIAAWYVERARQIREGDGEFADMQDLERIPQENKNLELAEQALNDAEDADRSAVNPRIDLLRAKISLQRGEDNVALALFRKHSDQAPTEKIRTESLKQIGFIYFRKRQFSEALNAFQQALTLVPTDAETVFLVGETHLRLHQPEKALVYYQKFDAMARKELQSEINRPEALYTGIATALNTLDRKHDAIEYYTLAIKHNPDLAAAITRRGWAYASHGLELARTDFEQAKQLNADNPDTLIGLGFTLARLGDWETAERELNTGVSQAQKQIADARNRNREETLQQSWTLFFNAACGYAQTFDVVRGDSTISIEQRKIHMGRMFQAVLQQLDEAVTQATESGQTARAIKVIETDPALDPVRSQSQFQSILKRARAIPQPGADSAGSPTGTD